MMAVGVRAGRYRNGWRSARAWEDFWTGLLCLSPAALISLTFVAGPILFSLYLSFHEWSILSPARPFVGLANYGRLLHSAEFWRALRHTAVYAAGVVSVGTGASLALAVLLHRGVRGQAFYRNAYFLPVAIPAVAAALAWTWLYEPQYGPLNGLLRACHLPAPAWLADPRWALVAVMAMGVWKNVGYHVVIFLAGLQGIPRLYYEAAAIDGAGGWLAFRHVTWPLLWPTTGFVLVTNTIFSFLVFGPIYVMTGGGPMGSTTVLVYLLYRQAFELRELGYASAMAWALFALVLALTILQRRAMPRPVAGP